MTVNTVVFPLAYTTIAPTVICTHMNKGANTSGQGGYGRHADEITKTGFNVTGAGFTDVYPGGYISIGY